jgi:hypothetical protein
MIKKSAALFLSALLLGSMVSAQDFHPAIGQSVL